MSREIILVLTVTGSAVIFLCNGVHSRCTNTTQSRNTGGSCSFEYNHCGWTDVNDNADDVSWERLDNLYYGQSSYIRVNFDGASPGSVAHLYSPWLCATGSNAFRSLTFRYSIEKSDVCRLSVFVVTKTHRKQVWETSVGTGFPFSQPVSSIYLQCSHEPFQIVFVGQKLTSESCGKSFDDISLDDIIFRDVFVTSTPHHDCDKFPPGVFTTALPPLPPTEGTVTHSIRDKSNVNIGALVGVLLALVIVVIAAVVAYLVWRRKKKQRQEIDQELHTKTRAMTNCTYMAGTDSLIPAVPHTDRSADVTSPIPIDVREDDDVADSAGNAAIYSVPDDPYHDPTMTPSPEDWVNSAPHLVPEFTGHLSATPSPLSRDSSCASRYNRLQRQGGDHHLGQGIPGEHTYNHLAERDESSRYESLARVDNFGEESRGAEGREPRAVSSSTMVSDYVDMNQMRGQSSGDLSHGAVYENCD